MRGVLFACLIWCGGCSVYPVSGRSGLVLMQMTPAQESELGMRVFPVALQQAGGEVPDLELQGYVQGVGLRVAQAGPRTVFDYQFRVANDPAPSAFALPGGYVVITRGLLAELQNEAQLAALLAHQVAHITTGHAAQELKRGPAARLASAVLDGDGRAVNAPLRALLTGQLGGLLLENSFSREQEREAARLGIDYMVAAGYDPSGLIRLGEILSSKFDQEQHPAWFSNLFHAHPFTRERLEDNRRYIDKRYAEFVASPGGDEGKAPFDKALRYVRESQEGYRLYGEARTQEASRDEMQALTTYLEAIKMAPREAYLVTAVGLAYLRQGDLITSRRYLKQAISLDSDYYQAYLAAGYLHVERKEYLRAIPLLERSMALLATIRGGYLLGEAYVGSGDVAKAQVYFRAVADADSQGKMGQLAAQRLDELELQ